jgi:hypothetical protein
MRLLLPVWVCLLFLSFGTSGLFAATASSDAGGCADLKLFPKIVGCSISECSSKRHDSFEFELNAEQRKTIEGGTQAITYSCPASVTPIQLSREIQAAVKKASLETVYEDLEDTTDILITARLGEDTWMEFTASTDEDATEYTVTSLQANESTAFVSGTCSELDLFKLPNGCTITECTAKKTESVEMRTSLSSQNAFAGPVRTVALACEQTVTPALLFETAQTGLKAAGLEILFSDRQRPDYSWLTARAGGKWVELMSFQDAETIAYQLTGVQTGRPDNKKAASGASK